MDENSIFSQESPAELPDIVVSRRDELAEYLTTGLKGIPVAVLAEARDVIVKFFDLLIVGVVVEDNTFKLYNVSERWVAETDYRCEKADNGTWFYYVETIDECIDQVKRIVRFEQNPNKPKSITYEKQLEKSGLEELENRQGDPRKRLISMLEPIMDNSRYMLKINKGDTSNLIVDLFPAEDSFHRVMGFSISVRNADIPAFFNKNFYNQINRTVKLPENRNQKKTQPHVTLTMKQLWNVLCVANGKKEYMV